MLQFVTTNEGKVREAREYLDDEVTQLDFDYREIQADNLAAVAADGARKAYRHTIASGTETETEAKSETDTVTGDTGTPVIVDDAGLFIDAFDGFPGPYSAYVEDTVGVERVWRLTEPEDDHSAAFRGVIAYCDGTGFDAAPDQAGTERAMATTDEQIAGGDGDGTLPVKIFEGYVPGKIVPPRGEGGFGYDPIFEHDGKTFAEMTPEEKNAVSHRGRALARFGEWYHKRTD